MLVILSFIYWLREYHDRNHPYSQIDMLNFTMFWFAPICMVLQHFKGLSFPTISSVGPNAAVIHYSPDAKTCLELDADSIYLFDSGAQVSYNLA